MTGLVVPASAAEPLAKGEVRALAEEAAIYGFPLVMNYGVIYESFIDAQSPQYKGPFNELFNTARVYTPKDTAVVTPNSDTPYSFFCADLRAEPVVFSVPKIEAGRYFSVQLVDFYTFNYGYVGSRTTGNVAGHYMIAGPNWQGSTPAGIDKVFRCETEFTFAIIRTQLFRPDDIENVKAIQAGYRLQALSSYLKQPAPAAPPAIVWPKLDKALAMSNPFEYLSFILTLCPPVGPAAVEQPLRDRLARLGVVAGQPFAPDRFTPDQQQELREGLQAAAAKIQGRAEQLGRDVNGWRVGAAFGDRQFYQGDWLLRAAAAKAGIYGNNVDEALYPLLATDSDGEKPNSGVHRYTITFPADGLPPAKAFWSVTMYDGKTQLLIDNPLNRYLINAPMLPDLKRNADGSLTLYLQKDSPGADKESNWLPAPDGPMYVAMRLYWPEPAAIKGLWKPPAVVKVK